MKLPRRPTAGVTREQPGLDPTPIPARPSPATAALVAAALVISFGVQFVLAREVRAEMPSLETELRASRAEEQTLEARLAELSDASRDARIVYLLDAGAQLDALLPYTSPSQQPPIETFEVDLPSMMAAYGLDASDIRRGVIETSEVGGATMSVRLSTSGPREGLFAWVEALRDHERLVTIETLQMGLSVDTPGMVSAEVTLLLWFADGAPIETQELEAGGRAPDPPADDDAPGEAPLTEEDLGEEWSEVPAPGDDADTSEQAPVPSADADVFADLDA